MFGYELTDTLCLLCADEFHILTSKKKADFLNPLAIAVEKHSSLPKIVTHLRNKVVLLNFHFFLLHLTIGRWRQAKFPRLIEVCTEQQKCMFYTLISSCLIMHFMQGRTIGIFAKDSFTGELVEGWKNVLAESSLEQVRWTMLHAVTSYVMVRLM